MLKIFLFQVVNKLTAVSISYNELECMRFRFMENPWNGGIHVYS